MDLGISGKTALVTGGASNIGRGIVFCLAREGANVAIADIDEKQAARVAGEASELKGGGKTVVARADATAFESVSSAVDGVLKEFGKIDILVNCVGYDELYLFVETKPDFWDKIIARNYKSMLNFSRAVVPYMIQQKHGRVVSLGSEAGRIGEFKEAVYAGTKGAIIAFSKSLAREVAKYSITVNVVCPGVVAPKTAEETSDASMWKGQVSTIFTPEAQKAAASLYPLRRLGTAQDVADAVTFLASDRASYITGQTLSVSGGYSMV